MTRRMDTAPHMRPLALALALALLPTAACATTPVVSTLIVTATAYNTHPEQTDADANIAAWGDELEPGMKAIAVSPDLLEAGLTHGTKVTIEGLDGEYTVL